MCHWLFGCVLPRFENKAALGLLTRFVSNGREADGTMSRDRLKIIARWVVGG
jgi:hypothetical protein